jgi:hypothetical protein
LLVFFELQDMDKLHYKLSPLSETLRLLGEVTRKLPETGREMELALELIEFTELLITLNICAQPQTSDGSSP